MTPLFKKKKVPPAPPSSAADRIVVMPEIFYGGADPSIYPRKAKSTETVLSVSGHSSARKEEKKANLRESAAPQVIAETGASIRNTPTLFEWVAHHKRLSVVAASGFFLLFVSGATWYYLSTASPAGPIVENAARETNMATQTVVPPVAESRTSTPSEVGVPLATSTAATSTVPLSPSSTVAMGLIFPPLFLSDAPDTDNDTMTDMEEEVFGTDPGVWDTDNDGYYDGQEVMNLYNPRGFAPIRIIDSGLVREYVHPTERYRFYYPAEWQVGIADPVGSQVVVSTIQTDFISITRSSLASGESFESWFARSAAGQRFADISLANNRFGVPVYSRRDGLVSYIVDTTRVYVVSYHTGGENSPVFYRHLLGMIATSFRPESNRIDLPEQVPVPPSPLGTVSGT